MATGTAPGSHTPHLLTGRADGGDWPAGRRRRRQRRSDVTAAPRATRTWSDSVRAERAGRVPGGGSALSRGTRRPRRKAVAVCGATRRRGHIRVLTGADPARSAHCRVSRHRRAETTRPAPPTLTPVCRTPQTGRTLQWDTPAPADSVTTITAAGMPHLYKQRQLPNSAVILTFRHGAISGSWITGFACPRFRRTNRDAPQEAGIEPGTVSPSGGRAEL